MVHGSLATDEAPCRELAHPTSFAKRRVHHLPCLFQTLTPLVAVTMIHGATVTYRYRPGSENWAMGSSQYPDLHGEVATDEQSSISPSMRGSMLVTCR